MIPDANYVIAVSPIDGTCPSDLLSQLQSALDDANQSHTIQHGPCRQISGILTATGTSRACTLSISFSAQGTESGLEDGEATLTATCDDSTACTHQLAITFRNP
jgi:hypothetical protein